MYYLFPILKKFQVLTVIIKQLMVIMLLPFLPQTLVGTLLLHISPHPPVPYSCRRTAESTQHLFQVFKSAEEKKLSWPIFLLFPNAELHTHIRNSPMEDISKLFLKWIK